MRIRDGRSFLGDCDAGCNDRVDQTMMQHASKAGADRRLCRSGCDRIVVDDGRGAAGAGRTLGRSVSSAARRQALRAKPAMIALALMKAEVPHNDPAVQACMSQIRGRFATGGDYSPAMGDGAGTYEAAASIMALATEDAEANRGLIAAIATYIASHQNANGSWDYTHRRPATPRFPSTRCLVCGKPRTSGSKSRRRSGTAPRRGTCRCRARPEAGTTIVTRPSTRDLRHDGRGHRQPADLPAPARAVPIEAPRDQLALDAARLRRAARRLQAFDLQSAQIDAAVKRGMAWLSANFAPSNPTLAGQTPYYMLYGVERIGALADKQTLGTVDWYAKGRDFIRSTQQADGSWHSQHGPEMNTVWAVLFLVKSTAKTIQKITIRRLGAGTLLGGRELPKDLSSLTVAGGPRREPADERRDRRDARGARRSPRRSRPMRRSPEWSSGTTRKGPTPFARSRCDSARCSPTKTSACAGWPPGRLRIPATWTSFPS